MSLRNGKIGEIQKLLVHSFSVRQGQKPFRGERGITQERKVSLSVCSECLRPSGKHSGGSVRVWECVLASCVGDFIKTELSDKVSDFNLEYNTITLYNRVYGKHLIGTSFIFQHDNHPKHTVNAVNAYQDRRTDNETLSVID